MALTAGEITELKNLLIRDANNVNEDGIVVQAEKRVAGDLIRKNCGRIRDLLAKL
jgi:hypothetical protein